jgi:heme O synthase-like polyprenyltransferase
MALEDPKQTLKRELNDSLDGEIDDATAERALDGPQRSRFATVFSENQLLIGITLATAVVFGVVLSVFLDSWVFLVVAVLVHGLGTLATTALAVWMTASRDKPDPRTVARLEEQGVTDPEQALNDAVHNARSG